LLLFARHLSEQNFTSAQFFSHFLRQANGLLHAIQTFSGRFSFLTPFIGFLRFKLDSIQIEQFSNEMVVGLKKSLPQKWKFRHNKSQKL
jgi:hypothetical protein